MPNLNSRALAQIICKPKTLEKVLYQQKHPKEGAQKFMAPYYQKALTGIRSYYRNGNNKGEIASALSNIQSIGNDVKRANNIRALEAFSKNGISQRKIGAIATHRWTASMGSVDIRLAADIQGSEQDAPVILYFNFKGESLNPEEARLTVEIAHWVSTQTGHFDPTLRIGYHDLFTGTYHQFPENNTNVSQIIKSSIQAIEATWNDI